MTIDNLEPEDGRLFAPAAARNSAAITDVLQRTLPKTGTVLEISSGTGQHAAAFADAFPSLIWQPSDIDPAALISIAAWRLHSGLANFHHPIELDVLTWPWSIHQADALFCANMIHIAPWLCCASLFEGAAKLLPAEAPVILYGPFKIGGRHTAPSNEAFDLSLKAQHPEWGVRDLEMVQNAAEQCGFQLKERAQMPANNFCLIFEKRSD